MTDRLAPPLGVEKSGGNQFRRYTLRRSCDPERSEPKMLLGSNLGSAWAASDIEPEDREL